MLDSWPQPLERVVEGAGRSGVDAAAELVLYIRTVAAATAVDPKPRIAAVAV